MTETNGIPEPAEKPESEISAEQSVSAESGTTAGQTVQQGQMGKEVNKDARMWAMFCHLGGLAALLPILPFIGGIIAPLIIWQIKKDDHLFVNEQGKEAVNFQISILLYEIVAGLLIFLCVGAFLLPAVMIFDIVFLIIAAIKANDGFHYRYPLCIRFIK